MFDYFLVQYQTNLIFILVGLMNILFHSLIFNFSPAAYWMFTYLFDIIISIVWFCYLLAIYCLFDVAFNGTSNGNSQSENTIPLEFANAWNLRVQFYPLTILIVLPTLPFAYLLTKLFKSDILVCILLLCMIFCVN